MFWQASEAIKHNYIRTYTIEQNLLVHLNLQSQIGYQKGINEVCSFS